MSIIATGPTLFIFIIALIHILSLRISEKLHSHSAKVIENVHAIFNRTNKLGELSSSHFLTGFVNVSGRSLEDIANHLRCQSRSS